MHIKSSFILNGVCVFWRGWIELQRLEGFGCLEYDTFQARCEEAALRQQIDKQQMCNNAAAAAMHQPSPLGGYHHPHHHPFAALNPFPTAPTTLPNGLPPPNAPGCLPTNVPTTGYHSLPTKPSVTAAALNGPAPPPPDSYGNAAIAAAAAAAFHQALSRSDLLVTTNMANRT